MAEQQPQLNPWTRANLAQFDEYTLGLLPEADHPQYTAIMQELGAAAMALMDAQERYRAAVDNRNLFFRGRGA